MRRGTELFPRVIDDIADLPYAIRDAVEPVLSQTPIRQLIVIPPQKYQELNAGRWRWIVSFIPRLTPHRTLVFQPDQITLVEGAAGEDLRVIPIPLAAMVAFNVVTVLLYSYIEFTWIAADQIKTLRIEFNSVGLHLITRELDQSRSTVPQPLPLSDLVPAPSHSPVSLAHLPLKFRNFTRMSLVPGETIQAVVYEPSIGPAHVRFTSGGTPNRVIVLTNQTLMVIEDANPKKTQAVSTKYQYGRLFCLRHRVVDVRFDVQSDVTQVAFVLGAGRAHMIVHVPLLPPRVQTLQSALESWLLSDVSEHQMI